ncbi:MAG TPA: acyl-CoA dehydrogenase family protein [Acidimicrobiales bacterium]|nr:acyl-CoA dehydrogenase family protein [Acidimicrobiales bacterium]
MRFSFDERQEEFRAQLRAFAEKRCTPAHVREAWVSELGWSPARWEALAELGVTAVTVPEPYGGLGLGMVDLVLLLEEAGRACLPEPLVETAAIGVPALSGAPGARAEELRLDWLPRIAAGESVLAVGLSSMSAVPCAVGTHLLLLEHRTGDRVELHALRADEVHQSVRASIDGTRRLSVIEWQPAPETLVVAGHEAEVVLAGIGQRAAMGTGAVLLGVADKLVDMAAKYAMERVQFERPIGSYQAVKHLLANALVRLEFARPVVYRAAWAIDSGDPVAAIGSSMAKAQASEAALSAARAALQVHGAIGYTWEHDLHLWMKRAWVLAAAWGDASSHRARVLEAAVAGTA